MMILGGITSRYGYSNLNGDIFLIFADWWIDHFLSQVVTFLGMPFSLGSVYLFLGLGSLVIWFIKKNMKRELRSVFYR